MVKSELVYKPTAPITNQTANSETSLYDFGETDDLTTYEIDDFLISKNESLGVFNNDAFQM